MGTRNPSWHRGQFEVIIAAFVKRWKNVDCNGMADKNQADGSFEPAGSQLPVIP